MSPQARNVIDRLEEIRQKWWIFTLLCSLVWAVAASLGLFLLFSVVDAVFRLPQTGLAVGFGVWLLATLGFGVFVVRRVFSSQRTLEGTARCLESEYPELQSNLINLVQLSEDTHNENRAFCNAAIDQAAREVDKFPLGRATISETRFRRFLYCLQTPRDLVEASAVLIVLLVCSVFGSVLFPNWSSAASRLTKPWSFVPSVGNVKLVVSPGNTEVLAGSPLEVRVEATRPAVVAESATEPLHATLFYRLDGAETEETVPMVLVETPTDGEGDVVDGAAEGNKDIPTAEAKTGDNAPVTGADMEIAEKTVKTTLKGTIPVVPKALKYRIEVGDSQSEQYRVTVLEKPTIGDVAITYTFPAYMKKPPQVVNTRTPDLVGPQYAVAELRVTPTVPITTGRLEWEGGGITGEVREEGRVLLGKMELNRSMTYKIRLRKGEFEDPQPRLNNVRVEVDRAPNVEMIRPTAETSVTLGQSVGIGAKLTDDFGISAVWLEAKVREGQAAGDGASGENASPDAVAATGKDGTMRVYTWPVDTAVQPLQQTVEYSLTISEQLAKPGQTLMVRVVALDNRSLSEPRRGLDLKPQQSAGPWRTIKIIDKEAAAETMQTQIDTLRDGLRKLMEKQIRNRLRTAMIGTRKGQDERLGLAGEVRTVQIEVQKEAIRIVKSITGNDRPEDQLVKRDLNKLAFTQMTAAVEQADVLLKSATPEAFDAPSSALQTTQGVIIDMLRNLLGISRAAEMKALEQMGMRTESDLPDDVKKKMEALKKSLDEALEAQRKVIEAGRALNKENVEDFSEDQEQLLKQLAAAEDAWEKFVKEATTDLSKLPFQDFANPSLLNELIEIQTELQRKSESEDALKKSADIAVPLEQLGAEMAEEIKTNFEKFLPDTADRERWSQEEMATDAMKEAPAAELPLELEDLIGELMEEEDDLFDEMEDMSSSMMDSLDAGAAWDVADGPISNMSAKGATGNRLPNTSEIGGRAGEGRQGKSSGEFVGNEAVGKGGRNTPTRLTPDPFVKGQIKDHSKEQAGGATGGGKDSGEGGEGLEGPQARGRTRETNRLPGKQADLRNRAEGIDLNHMKVMGYHNQDMEELIDAMDQTEKDFRGGRYQNIPRTRRVLLEGLEDVKRHVGGDFQMKEDTTYNLPTNIQEQMLGADEEPSPAGWESVNRDYFRKLSEGATGDP